MFKNITISIFSIFLSFLFVYLLADKIVLPDFHVIEEDKWVGDGSMLRVEAHCDLVRDNLLDLTHAKFTHKQTLATDDVDKVPVTAERSETIALSGLLLLPVGSADFSRRQSTHLCEMRSKTTLFTTYHLFR